MWELTVVSAQDEAHREVEREEGVSCARDGCARRYLLTKDEICSCSRFGGGGRMGDLEHCDSCCGFSSQAASSTTTGWLPNSDEGR